MMNVLCVRPDNMGDVLLTGPAVRAVAAGADDVTYLTGPRGVDAARLLPGVSRTLVQEIPWIGGSPVVAGDLARLVSDIADLSIAHALVFTSFHQSPLPMALLLRLAGIDSIAAISDDYPGSLLDVRHRVGEMHEVERNLSLAATLGFRLPAGDDGRLALEGIAAHETGRAYVVVHPGSSVPARGWDVDGFGHAAALLREDGWDVVVTGGPEDAPLTAAVAASHPGVHDLGGRTGLADLAAVMAGAVAVVAGNTGPGHLAAAAGTPVVSVFPPTVPAHRWRPWGVNVVILGDQDIACAGCRASVCPIPGHPCVGRVKPGDVVDAVRRVVSAPDTTLPALAVGR